VSLFDPEPFEPAPAPSVASGGPAPGPPAPCAGVGRRPLGPAAVAFHVVCPECEGLAGDIAGRVGPHLPGGLDPDNPPCGRRGPRVANAGSPFCMKPAGHHDKDPSDPHQAHDSWGHVTW
jgi:hypothetical protein